MSQDFLEKFDKRTKESILNHFVFENPDSIDEKYKLYININEEKTIFVNSEKVNLNELNQKMDLFLNNFNINELERQTIIFDFKLNSNDYSLIRIIVKKIHVKYEELNRKYYLSKLKMRVPFRLVLLPLQDFHNTFEENKFDETFAQSLLYKDSISLKIVNDSTLLLRNEVSSISKIEEILLAKFNLTNNLITKINVEVERTVKYSYFHKSISKLNEIEEKFKNILSIKYFKKKFELCTKENQSFILQNIFIYIDIRT